MKAEGSNPPGDGGNESRGINPPAESKSTLKRTDTLIQAGFSPLSLSASELIPRMDQSPG